MRSYIIFAILLFISISSFQAIKHRLRSKYLERVTYYNKKSDDDYSGLFPDWKELAKNVKIDDGESFDDPLMNDYYEKISNPQYREAIQKKMEAKKEARANALYGDIDEDPNSFTALDERAELEQKQNEQRLRQYQQSNFNMSEPVKADTFNMENQQKLPEDYFEEHDVPQVPGQWN